MVSSTLPRDFPRLLRQLMEERIYLKESKDSLDLYSKLLLGPQIPVFFVPSLDSRFSSDRWGRDVWKEFCKVSPEEVLPVVEEAFKKSIEKVNKKSREILINVAER